MAVIFYDDPLKKRQSPMIDNQKFVDLITQTNNGQKTGRMYAYTRVGGRLSFATLFFNDGQLSSCEFNDKSGNLALSEVIGSQITTVVFVAGDGSDYARDSSIMDLNTLLSSIEHQITDSVQASIKSSELKDIATDALKTICGDNAIKLVSDLVERFPPEQKPDKFIDECLNLASSFVGRNLANDILKPLLVIRS